MSGDAGVSIYPLFPRDLSTFSGAGIYASYRSLIYVQSRSGPDGVRFCRYFHTRISLDTRITIRYAR